MTIKLEPGYLSIQGVGSIDTLEDQKNWSDACYREAIAHNASRVLIDDRQLHFNVGILDQCDVVKHYSEEFEAKIRRVRVAIVVNQDDEELHDFWQLYAGNRGFLWKVFKDIDAAVDYLAND